MGIDNNEMPYMQFSLGTLIMKNDGEKDSH